MEKQYTDEEIADALFQSKGVQAAAARILGCHENTVWLRLQSSDVVKQGFRRGLGRLADKAITNVDLLLDSLDEKVRADMTKYATSRLLKEYFTERSEITGADGGAVRVEVEYVNEAGPGE